jgi:hypothetical protein
VKRLGLLILALALGYAIHASLHRNDISAEQHWTDMGGMAGNYAILKGQCEAARDAYLKERTTVLAMLAENSRHYFGKAIADRDYAKADLVCDAKQ